MHDGRHRASLYVMRHPFSLVIVLSVGLTGCSGQLLIPEGQLNPDQCSPENPGGTCPAGQACLPSGICAGPCGPMDLNGTCPDGEFCAAGSCLEIPCSADYPEGLCPSGFTCNAGTCEDLGACSISNLEGSCPEGERCTFGICFETPLCSSTEPEGRCEIQSEICVDGICVAVPPCSITFPFGSCERGERCIAGECMPVPCSRLYPDGFCTGAGERCTPTGMCVVQPCSMEVPDGSCPRNTLCLDGTCQSVPCSTTTPLGSCVDPAETCVSDPASPDFGTCQVPCSPMEPAGWCDGGEECVSGVGCLPECTTQRCGLESKDCCPSAKPICVFNLFCQAECPNAADDRCGGAGDICCDSSLSLVCNEVLQRCVEDCSPTQTLCGMGTPETFGDACCDTPDVCIFDECRTPTNTCESFIECAPDEYCELILDPPGCETTGTCGSTGQCLPDEGPPGTEMCQGRPTDLFDPLIEWHFLGVRPDGSGGFELCEDTGDYSGSCYLNVETAPVVADMDKVIQSELTYQSPWATSPTTFPADTYPEVIFKAYRTGSFDDHILTILDGRDGSLRAAIAGHHRGHIAVGNLDADPTLELVVAHGNGNGVLAQDPFYTAPSGSPGTVCPTLDTNGACEVNWTNNTAPLTSNFNLAAPTLTDFNGDGQAEVVMGTAVLDGRDGTFVLAPSTQCPGGGPTLASLFGGDNNIEGPIVSVADIDLDGVPEIIAGNTAVEISETGGIWSCSHEWTSTDVGGDGYVAIGNFVDNTQGAYATEVDTTSWPNDRDYPEVVVIWDGTVAILHGKTGRLMKSPVDQSPMSFGLFSRRGGTPNIADFDGDTRVEVSFAGPGCMVVIDPDCAVDTAAERIALAADSTSGCAVAPASITACGDFVQAGISDMLGILWMDQTQDQSSAATGTTVFDFQGDGKSEVLYNDECFFRVYDGESGTVLLERPNSHRTGTEYPIVVDADGDRNSEILFVGTHDQSNGRDQCNGSPGSRRAYRDGLDKNGNSVDIYSSTFCTCGNLVTQQRCDSTPGCAWNGAMSQCEVSDSPRPDDPADICQNGTWGVWALGDTQDQWVRTLPYWHQHAYHVTEVNVSGQPVPDWGPGANNWEIYNSYRQNVQGFIPLNAPDLQIFSFTATLNQCPSVQLNVRVVNRGRAGIPANIPLDFFVETSSGPLKFGTAFTSVPLLPGQGTDVQILFSPLSHGFVMEPPAGWNFNVIANPDDGAMPAFECLTDNNQASLIAVPCVGGG